MLKLLTILATVYTPEGPVIYPLASGLSGPACIARLQEGLQAADRAAIRRGDIQPAGEGHVPAVVPGLSGAVLSCELDW